MAQLRLLAFVASIIGAAVWGTPQEALPQTVYFITVDDSITPFMAEYIKTSIDTATANNASALLIHLDTPGGLLGSTRKIVQDILQSPVPIIVYVSPAGARAGSAGVLITLAAHIAAMAPSSNIGAAHPVDVSGDDIKGDMKDKITNDTKAWARSIAETRKRNADWAEQAVVSSESITAKKALELGVIDVMAEDVKELLGKIDGKIIQQHGARKTELKVKDAQLIAIPMSLRQGIMKFLSNPNLVYILMLLGILGILIEFQSPGIILPGLFGVICLAVVFFVQVLPINWFGVLLIFLAAACLIAEIFITSFGLLAIVGLSLLVMGSYLLFSVDGSGLFVEPVLIWLVSGGFSAIIIAIGLVLVRARRQGATANVDALVGKMGVVTKSINPPDAGVVVLNGSFWRAYSDETIASADKVIVKRVDSTKLFVEKTKD